MKKLQELVKNPKVQRIGLGIAAGIGIALGVFALTPEQTSDLWNKILAALGG